MSGEADRWAQLDELIAAWRRRVGTSTRLSADALDELEDHLRELIAEGLRQGRTAAEARSEAESRLGGLLALESEFEKVGSGPAGAGEATRVGRRLEDSPRQRPVGRRPWTAGRLTGRLEALVRDVRFAVRLMAGAPGSTAVAVSTLAIGIGATTAVFSLANATLLRAPRHVEDPEELVLMYHSYRGNPMLMSYPEYREYRDRNEVFVDLAAYHDAPVHLRVGEWAERLQAGLVTGNYFEVLGVTAARGRLLLPSDDVVPGGHPVVVIDHSLWNRAFAADPGVVGTQVALNGRSFTIIGVAPEGFSGVELGTPVEVWVPMAMIGQVQPEDRDRLSDRRSGWLRVFGRLRAGVAVEVAEERMTALVQQVPHETIGGEGAHLYPDIWVSPYVRRYLQEFNGALAAVVGLVLLLACANLASLLLAQATGRHGEGAIRRALGASRRRLAEQMLVEGLVLAALGGASGLLLAHWTTAVLTSSGGLAAALPAGIDPSIDARVLGFCLMTTLGSGLAFSLGPALRASRRSVMAVTRGELRVGGRRSSRLRGALAASQVASAFVVLVGAGLLLRTLVNLTDVDPGFDAASVITVSVDFEREGYGPERTAELTASLVGRLSSLPRVDRAAAGDRVPFGGPSRGMGVNFVSLEGHEPPSAASGLQVLNGQILVGLNRAGVGYLEALGIPVVAGRSFVPADATSSPVVIVNERAADGFWPGENAIGQQLRVRPGRPDSFVAEVVGVVADSRDDLRRDAGPQIFLPLERDHPPAVVLVAHVVDDPRGALTRVRAAVHDVDPNLTMFAVGTLYDFIAEDLGEEWFLTVLLATFGLVALGLAGVGIFGVLAHAVGDRRHEFGVRLALGATPRDVTRLVLRDGMIWVTSGIVLGGLGAAWLSRLLEGWIWGVERTDPLTFAAIAVFATAGALLAALVPARRALAVDPVVALRSSR